MGEAFIVRRSKIDVAVSGLNLFMEGESYPILTGGWVKGASRDTENLPYGVDSTIFLYTKDALNTTSGGVITMRTSYKIDFTNYSKICADISYDNRSSLYCGVSLALLNTDGLSAGGTYTGLVAGTEYAYPSYSTGRSIIEVDTTSISGSYYVSFRNYLSNVNVHRVWVE